MKESWFKRRWVVILLHTAFWSLLFFLPYLLQPSFQERRPPAGMRPLNRTAFPLFNLIKCIFWAGLFYLNAYVLVPRFVYRKKYWQYVLLLLLMVALLSLVEIIYFQFSIPAREFPIGGFVTFNLFPFCFVVAASTAYKMMTDKNREEKLLKEKESENLKTELSFLRTQISPHFMFNVLNNIVALARKNSDQVEPSLLKLSSIMRYFLYENTKNAIPLEKELDYLKNYIELQEQRFGQRTIVQFSIGAIDASYQIEPMLLIPFVENAFKHGIIQNGSICAAVEATNGTLQFSVKNRYRNIGEQKDETSGIGLSNVKRRLNLLYANKYALSIDDRDEKYFVSLQLKLQ